MLYNKHNSCSKVLARCNIVVGCWNHSQCLGLFSLLLCVCVSSCLSAPFFLASSGATTSSVFIRTLWKKWGKCDIFCEVVVKGGKAAVPAPTPAKKAPALAPSSSEAPTSVLGVPAPAPSLGPSVSNYFRMKPLVYSVASEAWSISLLDCWWKAFSMVVGSGMISPISLAFAWLWDDQQKGAGGLSSTPTRTAIFILLVLVVLGI